MVLGCPCPLLCLVSSCPSPGPGQLEAASQNHTGGWSREDRPVWLDCQGLPRGTAISPGLQGCSNGGRSVMSGGSLILSGPIQASSWC